MLQHKASPHIFKKWQHPSGVVTNKPRIMKKVKVSSKGITSKGGFWVRVEYSASGFLCSGFVTPESQEVYDAITEGQELTVPFAAIRVA